MSGTGASGGASGMTAQHHIVAPTFRQIIKGDKPMRKLLRAAALLGLCVSSLTALAQPVVYTLRTVADGQLGSWTFSQATLTLTFTGDTRTVHSESDAFGTNVLVNRDGQATVTVSQGGKSTSARFGAGQVYLRYDMGNNIVGFASAIAPSYPIAMNCFGAYWSTLLGTTGAVIGPDCTSNDAPLVFTGGHSNIGTSDAAFQAQTGVPLDEVFSTATVQLPLNLSQTTLLTGLAHTCATSYNADSTSCTTPAPAGLLTNRGLFYLQDQLPSGLDDFANSAQLRVELLPGDD